MKQTFEDYLKYAHSEQADGALNDDMLDNYENWLAGLQVEELISYAEQWGEEQYIAGLKETSEGRALLDIAQSDDNI